MVMRILTFLVGPSDRTAERRGAETSRIPKVARRAGRSRKAGTKELPESRGLLNLASDTNSLKPMSCMLLKWIGVSFGLNP